MEPYHVRRGRENNVLCGLNRGKQTLLLMLAMAASMALVLVWETSPFARSGVVLTPIHGNIAEPGSDLEELVKSYEMASPYSRKSPALEINTDEGTDVDDEKRKAYDRQSVNYDRPESPNSSSSSEVGSSAVLTGSDATSNLADGQGFKDLPGVVKQQDRERIIVEETTTSPDSDEKDARSSTTDIPEITVTEDAKVPSFDAISFSERENETESTGSLEAVAPYEGLQRSNEEVATVPESEETISLAEEKAEITAALMVDHKASSHNSSSKLNVTRQLENQEELTENNLVERLTGQLSESEKQSTSADEMGISVDNELHKRRTSTLLGGVALLSDEILLEEGVNGSKAAKNQSSAVEDDEEAEVVDAVVRNNITREMTKNLSKSAMEDDEEAELADVVSQDNSIGEITKNLSKSAIEDDEAGFKADAISQEKPGRDNANSEIKLCDYTVGKWVLDKTRPLYSGRECSLWLSPDFACRLHNHPDKQMDQYRWQPAGCNLPAFNASAVLETLRDKVVAFVGDSLGRQQLQSLLCMLTRGKNTTAISDVGSWFNFYTPRGARRPTGFAYRFDATNTTVVFKWTVTLARVQPLRKTNPLTLNALHLDRPEKFLEDHLHKLDILILNSGHHWNNGKMQQNRYEFYNKGKPVAKSSDLSRVPVAYNATVHNIVKWIHEKTKNTEKVIYYRSLSPRHFRNGDWNTGGTCDTIQFEGEKQMQEGKRVDPNAESAIAGTSVNLLNITSLSLARGATHVSKYGGGKGGQDCLHWCLPGIPDTWNEILLAELAAKFKSRTSRS